jgi:hypothetical protein
MSPRLAVRIGGAALSLAALAACSDPVTAPSARTPVLDTPSFALAASYPSTSASAGITAEIKTVTLCNAGPQSASFNAINAATVGGDVTIGTLLTPAAPTTFTLGAGLCTVIATQSGPDDNVGSDNPILVTTHMTTNFQSVSIGFTDGVSGCPALSGTTGNEARVCMNNYHGAIITYVSTNPPPPPTGCTFTKGWYRNNGSNTVVAVDGRSKADAQAIFAATPGKPGNVTWEGDNNTLNLYQQLLAAILNGGLNGPAAVQKAIADAQAATGGTGQNITLVSGTDVSALIDALTFFNEGNYAGWPHCG